MYNCISITAFSLRAVVTSSCTVCGWIVGLVWLVDSYGSMFCFIPSPSDGVNLISVDPPEPRQTCQSFSASVDVAWCVLDNGHVYIRRQMAGHCLPGYGWDKVDMIQIGLCFEGLFLSELTALKLSQLKVIKNHFSRFCPDGSERLLLLWLNYILIWDYMYLAPFTYLIKTLHIWQCDWSKQVHIW